MAWLDNLGWAKKITAIAGMVTASLAAIFAVANAMQLAEPHWVATRGFARELVQATADTNKKAYEAIEQRQQKTDLSVKEAQRQQIQSKIDDLNLLLKKDGSAPVEYTDAIQRQIRDNTIRLNIINEEIGRITRELVTGRPQ